MVTLDGNLSNPLDQKLHTLLGHHQYISPITTIIYISHSFTQPRTFHNQHNNILHTTYHIQQSNYIHQQPIGSITWSCRSHAGSCRSHAGCHAVTCTLYPYICCMWLCITWSLIWAIFPSMTSLFDRLCRHMTWWLCILVQFWLY